MELNYDGRLAQLYRWSYDDSCPNDLCTYFWKLLFALAVFPITWTTKPFDLNGIVKRIFAGIGIWLAFIAVSFLLGTALGGDSSFMYAAAGAVGFFIALVIAAVILTFLIVGVLVGHEWVTGSETYTELKSMVTERKTSFKDKYCPRIDWHEKKNG